MTRGKKNERGASAVEYGLLVALVAAVIVGALIALEVTLAAGYSSAAPDCSTPEGEASVVCSEPRN